MSKSLAVVPLLNEKTYELSKSKNVFVFDVPTTSNKQSIAQAVKAQFDVEVVSVNTVNISGKAKRIMSLTGKRSVNAQGRRRNIKKAYVTLKAGSSLPFFEAIDEEEEKRSSTQSKIETAVKRQETKQAKQDSKPRRRLIRSSKRPEGK